MAHLLRMDLDRSDAFRYKQQHSVHHGARRGLLSVFISLFTVSKMPTLCRSRVLGGDCASHDGLRRGGVRAACFAVVVLLLAGCAPIMSGSLVSVLPDQPLLPSPELNSDLFSALNPSNNHDWSPDQAVLSTAEFHGEQVTVHNIRRITYRSLDDYTVTHYDKTFDLRKLTSVDFIMVPFNEMPTLAHTMISFGFEDRDYLGVSVETRKERGQTYGPLKGFLRQYGLIYVVADEQDLILRRVLFDRSDVYLYRTRATPAQARSLLADVMRRVNKLAHEPEFYNTLTNNCTTNIRNHINHLVPNEVPYDYRVLLPGDSDKLAYDLGLLESGASFEQTRLRARVNYLAYVHRDDADFSVKIRQ
jgi:hypothetical protein